MLEEVQEKFGKLEEEKKSIVAEEAKILRKHKTRIQEINKQK